MITENSSLLQKKREGLYCIPGDFFIDPLLPVDKALITHAHTDHAKPNNNHVLGLIETLDVMKIRYGVKYSQKPQIIKYNQTLRIGDVYVKFLPAGHILGSAQILITYKGYKVLISGDYKRRPDKTCLEYEPTNCHTFITEATFGLPIFKHPDDKLEINKLIESLKTHNNFIHLIGVYALGKCQRVISLLREKGYDDVIYLHGALSKITEYYISKNIKLGKIKNIKELDIFNCKNQLILCPPSALNDRWSRKFKRVIKGYVSGWMNIKQRVKQKNIELPIIISDHSDWFEIINTVRDNNPSEVLITHGREEALNYYLNLNGYKSKALSLLGFEDEDE